MSRLVKARLQVRKGRSADAQQIHAAFIALAEEYSDGHATFFAEKSDVGRVRDERKEEAK